MQKVQIRFDAIREHEGDQRKAFEEFVCQLAKRDRVPQAYEYRRVEGAGGDGGVECYWLRPDGTKRGYQAKYFLATKAIDWRQVDKSVKVALEKHPSLTEYVVAFACDLTDRSGSKGKGGTGWEKWEARRLKWHKWAASKGRSVTFVPWAKSEMVDAVVSSPDGRGLVLYWFDKQVFDQRWFQDLFDRIQADLGERFQPQDHVGVDVAKGFSGLRRDRHFLDHLSAWFRDLPPLDRVVSAINRICGADTAPSAALIADYGALRRISDSVVLTEAQPFPIEQWRDAILRTEKAASTVRNWLSNKEKTEEVHKDAITDALRSLSDLAYHLDTTPVHLGTSAHELRVESDHRRLLILQGEAGVGKSHLVAEATLTALSNGIPSIMLLGQHFAGRDLRLELLSTLGLSHHDFDAVLQALNAAGEAARARVVLAIDALNEAHDLRFWREQLAGFVTQVLKYEWLAVALTLRPEYSRFLVPPAVLSSAANAVCRGITTPEEQKRASVQYFDKRGIVRPAVPWLDPEFSNFLFLKTCCDTLQRMGRREFPRGLRGSLQILNFYLESIDQKLRSQFPSTDIPASAVSRTVHAIATFMADAKNDVIDSNNAKRLCEQHFTTRGPSESRSWFSILQSEGVFRREHVLPSDSQPLQESTEANRFTYQRFSDHLIAQALLASAPDLKKAFNKDGELEFLLDGDSWAYNSLWAALAIQIPEQYPGKELMSVLPAQKLRSPYVYPLVETFEQSLLWRASSAFSDETLRLFNTLPRWSHGAQIDTLLRLAAIRDHPWNAEMLDTNLRKKRIADRDAFWTASINKTFEDQQPLSVLIRWSTSEYARSTDKETLRLVCLAISWSFTSSNNRLRDRATKALISIGLHQPQLIVELVERFSAVDDLYVVERILASALGIVTRIPVEDVRKLAECVYRVIFASQQDRYIHLTVRDYARAVVEFASERSLVSLDMSKCRPPYKSSWPLKDVGNAEIEKLAKRAGGEQILHSALSWGDFARYEIEPLTRHFTAISLDSPRPLNADERRALFDQELAGWEKNKKAAFRKLAAAVKRYRRSSRITTKSKKKFEVLFAYSRQAAKAVASSEARFLKLLTRKEREQYSQLVRADLMPKGVNPETPRFDSELAKRWITRRAYEYGWSKKRFGDDQPLHGVIRDRPLVERIGKKYQWLALSEFAARLADNVWVVGGWPERAMQYDHPARDWFVRDVEPSIVSTEDQQEATGPWFQKHDLKMGPLKGDELQDWPFSQPPPNNADWMDVIDPNGRPWLVLYGLFNSRESREDKSFSPIAFRRDIFVRVSTILVEASKVNDVMRKLQGSRLSDPSGHETIDWTDGPFLCEYPWRNTWKVDNDNLFETDDFRHFKNIRYMRPVARHVWESHLDMSLKDGSAVYLPNPWLGARLGLRPNLARRGQTVGPNNQVFFLDPTTDRSGSHCAVVDKQLFLRFLEGEKLNCVWIVAGERNSWPSGHHGDYSCRSFGAVYRWTKRGWTGRRWHKDEKRTHQ